MAGFSAGAEPFGKRLPDSIEANETFRALGDDGTGDTKSATVTRSQLCLGAGEEQDSDTALHVWNEGEGNGLLRRGESEHSDANHLADRRPKTRFANSSPGFSTASRILNVLRRAMSTIRRKFDDAVERIVQKALNVFGNGQHTIDDLAFPLGSWTTDWEDEYLREPLEEC